jgi:hypothetical protein
MLGVESLADFDLSKMSDADRASIERMHAASRARWRRRLRALAIAVPIVWVASGAPPLLLFWLLDMTDTEVLAMAALPGLALASYVYKRLGPDDAGPIS